MWQAPRSFSVPDGEFFDEDGQEFKCPYGKPGDLLYVRETWAGIEPGSYAEIEAPPRLMRQGCTVIEYAATDMLSGLTAEERGLRYRPNIHMPKWAARIWLRVESVRVERLQEITEAGALADGGWVYGACPIHKSPVRSFGKLWNSNAKPGEQWGDNPWVFVVSFSVVSTTGRPS
jgi:hypothetical protein